MSNVCARWSFYINPVQQKIYKRWVDNVEKLIPEKLDIEQEDLVFTIIELYTSLVSCFGIEKIKKYGFLLVLYLFQDIGFLNQRGG